MHAQTSSKPARLDFLDALRGLAILGVISTHCAWYADGDFRGKAFAGAGLYGVQLFFMVSAFTIFLTLERALARETAVVSGFFIRRTLRILPMFWVGIVLYAFLPGREHYYTHFHPSCLYYLLTALLQHGWHPYYINAVVPGGWSIAVEGTFYLVAPFLFFRLFNWRRAWLFLLCSLFAATAANHFLLLAINRGWLFANIDSHEILAQFAFRWFPNQLPVFATGILTYHVVKAMPESFRTKRTGLILVITGLVILYNAVGLGCHRLLSEPFLFAAGFFPVIAGLAIYPWSFLVNRATCFLGRISYSFYLMHFVLMEAGVSWAKATVPALFSHPALAYVSLFIVTVLAVTPVAWLTYRFIEQPFIRLGSSLVRRLNAVQVKAAKTPAIFAPPFPET
ncbi:MAG TPA: acyltransferase [Verrucomicrobiae bacterium]